MIYRFRVILDNDTDEDIFRDIEIRQTDTLEDLHNAITQSFGFDGSEMASFYLSDDQWNQGEEISLFDMREGSNAVKLMNETIIEGTLDKDHTKLIYVYDALCGWCFGFSPVMSTFAKKYQSEIEVQVVSGGMIRGDRIGPIGEVAPYIKEAYKTVEDSTGITFGKAFLLLLTLL